MSPLRDCCDTEYLHLHFHTRPDTHTSNGISALFQCKSAETKAEQILIMGGGGVLRLFLW